MSTTDPRTDVYEGIDDLLVRLQDGVLAITLNRPDSLNSLTAPMLQTLASTLEHAAGDSRVRVVRIGGSGRGFCSGAGISEEDHANPGAAGTPADVLDAANRSIRAIAALPQPAVAVVGEPPPAWVSRWHWPAMSYSLRRRPFSCWHSPRSG